MFLLKGFYLSKYHGKQARFLIVFFLLFSLLFIFPYSVQAQFGGGSGGGNISRTLPSSSVTPLASDAPAPWGIDPATVSGLIVEDVIESPGFLQQKVTDGNGDSFFHQLMSASDFTLESYVDIGTGDIIFRQEITDPAFGLNETTMIDSFRQPISIHSDITEKNVAPLTNGLNQMDMHFSQVPFFDTASSKVLTRQDIGMWMTSFTGVMPNDITDSEFFTLSPGDLSHDVATSIPLGGGNNGNIDWWNDLEAVKIIDPSNNQLLNFSRCNDFGDPSARMGFNSDQGSRGGCSGSGSGGDRPSIPTHDSDAFQLTPINWERWGGSGSDSFSSGISTNFPNGGGLGSAGGFGP